MKKYQKSYIKNKKFRSVIFLRFCGPSILSIQVIRVHQSIISHARPSIHQNDYQMCYTLPLGIIQKYRERGGFTYFHPLILLFIYSSTADSLNMGRNINLCAYFCSDEKMSGPGSNCQKRLFPLLKQKEKTFSLHLSTTVANELSANSKTRATSASLCHFLDLSTFTQDLHICHLDSIAAYGTWQKIGCLTTVQLSKI
jgi:hypothetical protein